MSEAHHDAAGEGPGLAIRMLGGFELRAGGVPVPLEAFARRKAVALMKLLALAPRHALPRDAVIEALWPALPPERAAAQLQNAASQARRAVREALPEAAAGPWVALTAGSVALSAPGGVRTDLEAFEALAAAALASGERCDLQAASAAFGGSLLPEDPYETWNEDARRRTSATAARVWLELGRRSQADGLPGDAAEAFERVVELEPDDLDAHRALLRLAAGAGNAFAFERRAARLTRVFEEELGLPVPAALTAEIEELRAAVARPRVEPSGPVALPVPSTPLVGRWDDLARLLQRLQVPDCRLVTVTGMGGVGKTRLALEAARWWQAAGGRTAFVALETAEDVPTLMARVAATLGLPTSPVPVDEQRATIAAALAGTGALLVLDNFEQLADAAPTVGALVAEVEDLRCLVTSRRRLGLPGEWLFELRGLSVARSAPRPSAPPDHTSEGGGDGASGGGKPAKGPAVDLFVACARRVVPSLSFEGAALEAAGAVCRAVEGLPLAIELAAGWLRVLSPQALAEEMHERALLIADPGDGTPGGIVDVFERSWRRLPLERRDAYLALSVFREGFSRELAREVAGAGTSELLALVDASLVQREDDERFRLHEVLRRLAERRLELAGDAEAVRGRHARAMLAMAETLEHEMRGPLQIRWMARAARERANFEAALGWAARRSDASVFVRLAAALAAWWERVGDLHGGLGWLERALERAGSGVGVPSRDRARVLLGLGVLERHRGSWEASRRHLQEVERLGESARDRRNATYARHHLALLEQYLGNVATARELHAACLEAFEEDGDTVGVYLSLFHLAEVERRSGEDAAGEELHLQSLRLKRERGDAWSIAWSLYCLGRQALDRGDADTARERLRESLALRRSLGDRIGVVASLAALARASRDRPERGAELLAAAESARRALSARMPLDVEEAWRAEELALRRLLGAARWEAAVRRGRSRPLDGILDDVLEDAPDEPAAGGGLS